MTRRVIRALQTTGECSQQVTRGGVLSASGFSLRLIKHRKDIHGLDGISSLRRFHVADADTEALKVGVFEGEVSKAVQTKASLGW